LRLENTTLSPQSKSVEDFLKAVYALQQHSERASTSALSEVLNISPPSVTDMARRMVEAELVDYKKYRGVRLTEQGEQIALRVLRRHRLLELYLTEELDYALHEVHEEADKLEHAVSNRFIEAISKKLNYPKFDPHGDPIPSADGKITHRETVALAELPLGITATVRRYTADNAEMLQHTIDRGFKLGTTVEVVSRDPCEGPLTIHLDGESCVIGYTVATKILVEPI